MLQTDDGGILKVEKIRGKAVLIQLILLDLESHGLRILIRFRPIVHSDDRAIDFGVVFENCRGEVGGESGDAALSGKIGTYKSNGSQLSLHAQISITVITTYFAAFRSRKSTLRAKVASRSGPPQCGLAPLRRHDEFSRANIARFGQRLRLPGC